MSASTLHRPQPVSDFKISVREAQKTVLANNIPVYYIDAGTQDIIRLEIFFDAGVLRQQKPFQAMLTNMMLLEGTKQRSSAQISEEVDFYGGYLTVDYAKDFSNITLHILNKYFDKALAVVRDILTEPVFPEHELEQVIKNEKSAYIVDSEKVSYLAQKKLNEVLYKGHPYGTRSEAGDFEKVSRQDVVDFYKQYDLASATIVLAGNIKDEELKALDTFLGNIPVPVKSKLALPQNYSAVYGHHFVEKKEALQSAIKIGGHLPLKGSDDFFGLLVLNMVLGGYFGSRLMNNIREDKGWTYGISSYIESAAVSSSFIISTEVKGDVTERAIEEIFKEMNKLTQEAIPKQELEKIRTYMLGKFLKNLDGPFELSDRFWGIHQFGLGYDYYQKYLSTVKSISPAELQNLAQKYFIREKLVSLSVGAK
ncbi:MAG: M16 family metallopeptidase [Flavobacteriales bacterium]